MNLKILYINLSGGGEIKLLGGMLNKNGAGGDWICPTYIVLGHPSKSHGSEDSLIAIIHGLKFFLLTWENNVILQILKIFLLNLRPTALGA